ncbi:MAG: methyltransferase domain-containing protein [Phycisphaerales bacterium]|nr:methyltransferase domain-containing protein [Phycisphaerales bacterium]
MHPVVAESVRSIASASREKLRQFINAYWLRPENAFWMMLRSDALSAVPLAAPCADLSCGDGIFSFLHAGGRLAPEFDVFRGVGNLERVTADGGDMFDHVDASYQPRVIGRPKYRLHCGTDCKPTMLTKAAALDFYEHLTPHDHNHPLPFETDCFESVYCNAAYWVERIEQFLTELHRITVPGGTVALQVKLDDIGRYTLERHREMLGDRWWGIMHGDRFDHWPTLCDRSTWEQRFESAGFEILAAIPFVTGTHAHIWNVGLRPIAPMLIRAMNNVHDHLRAEIKRDWVDLFCDLLDPLCRPDFDLTDSPTDAVEIQYVLTPRG